MPQGIIDSTLREGEQCYGVYFTPEEKEELIVRLGRLGVDEIEIGVQGQEDLNDLLQLASRVAPNVACSVWCRSRDEDVVAAAQHGCRINMGLPVSEDHARQRLGLELGDIPVLATKMVTLAKQSGAPYVSLGLEDVSRAAPETILEVAAAALDAGAARIRLSDSVGLLDPGRMALLVELCVESLGDRPGWSLGVHCHNDFGMAMGNASTALATGASWADASVLGIGERAGITRLEELASWLALQRGKTSYNLGELRGLCAMVAEAADLPPSRLHPIVGRDVFSCESGLHVHAVSRNPALFEPFDPRHVQGERKMSVGKKSGRAAVRGVLRKFGVDLPPAKLEELVADCRQHSARLGRPLSDAELLSLAVRSMGKTEQDMQSKELQHA